ncbi:hypothetical protein F5880DRAFT_1544130 [Lentinula raphanica]|nr:hypothetical protein F5880DRAFT_1544130 [Lentinula raphanica]
MPPQVSLVSFCAISCSFSLLIGLSSTMLSTLRFLKLNSAMLKTIHERPLTTIPDAHCQQHVGDSQSRLTVPPIQDWSRPLD